MKKLILAAAALSVVGCASSPDKMQATHVSTNEYSTYSCEAIQHEQREVDGKTRTLYAQLDKDRKNDNAQMAVGLVLFWPALFLLEGGDGPEAVEYRRLKGESEALAASFNQRCL